MSTIPGSRHTEFRTHQWFEPHRQRGEWYRREGALAKFLDDGCPRSLFYHMTRSYEGIILRQPFAEQAAA